MISTGIDGQIRNMEASTSKSALMLIKGCGQDGNVQIISVMQCRLYVFTISLSQDNQSTNGLLTVYT